MVTPKNEPDTPASAGKPNQTRTTWIILLVLAILIFAGIAVVSNKPGAEIGGSLSPNGGSTRSDANRTP